MTTQATPIQSRSRLDPEALPRRDFLGLAAFWSAIAAGVASLVGMLRLPKAAVLPSPSRKFTVTVPDSLAPGTPFLPPGRSVAVFRDVDGVYAVSTICTHLGCIVKPEGSGFHCPCHGSRFLANGEVSAGPAPSPLPWLKVSRVDDGVFVVDEGSRVPQGTKEQV